ncbi:MAG: M28 family peptidase [Candidatus Thermoplasmatota archaeon]|nr:M28 family peptidase [Candidatus Thermoplasmatota archaeon]
MNHKKLCFLVGILLLIPIVSTTTVLATENPYVTPKKPGHMTETYPNLPVPTQIIQQDHRIPQPLTAQRPEIVLMMDDLTEPLYLGYLEDLVAFGPRVTNQQACWDAGDWIYDEFQAMGLEVRYQNWSYSGNAGSNIEATIPGEDPDSDEIFIVCAHYDSVSGSPGADDDGSGVVAAMSLAYIMRDYMFNHTIRFVAFSGEEQGLHGSHEYVVEAYNNGDNIIGTLNADMIGFALNQQQGSLLNVYNDDQSNWLYDYTESVSQEYYDQIGLTTIDSGFSWGSDHYYFWEFGYSAVFYHEYEFNHFYHSPQDTIANMNISYAVKSSKLILATLAELAESQPASEPPQKPTITGPAESIMGVLTNFTVTTTDPEGNDVYYFINWGDGSSTSWIGPYASGEMVTVTNTWFVQGTYQIQVRAKDDYNVLSDWSDPINITVMKGPLLDIEPINGGLLKVTAMISNNGEVPATEISWNMGVRGGFLLLDGGSSGVISTIPADGKQEISSGIIFGLGKITVTITAQIPNGQTDQRQQGGTVLLFFISMNPGGG